MKTIAFLSIGDKGLSIGYKKTGWERNIGEHLTNEGQKVIIIHYGDRDDCVEAANKVIRHHNQYFKKYKNTRQYNF